MLICSSLSSSADNHWSWRWTNSARVTHQHLPLVSSPKWRRTNTYNENELCSPSHFANWPVTRRWTAAEIFSLSMLVRRHFAEERLTVNGQSSLLFVQINDLHCVGRYRWDRPVCIWPSVFRLLVVQLDRKWFHLCRAYRNEDSFSHRSTKLKHKTNICTFIPQTNTDQQKTNLYRSERQVKMEFSRWTRPDERSLLIKKPEKSFCHTSHFVRRRKGKTTNGAFGKHHNTTKVKVGQLYLLYRQIDRDQFYSPTSTFYQLGKRSQEDKWCFSCEHRFNEK